LDLRDELGRNPHDVPFSDLGHLRDDIERRLPRDERLEPGHQLADRAFGEACTDVAHPDELIAAVHAEHERPEAARAPALPLRVAADDELLAVVRLELQPVPRTLALEVARALALRHHALEALLQGSVVERLAVIEELGDLHRPLPLVEQRREPLPPLLQREVGHRHTVDLQNVEDRVDDLRVALSLLHRGEARTTLLVERAHLPVDDAFGRADRALERLRDVGEPLCQVVLVARDETCLASAHVTESAVTVPFHLVQPVVPLWQILCERGEHWLVVVAHRPQRVVALTEQEPVLRIAVELRGNERPRSLEPLPVQPHGETAGGFLLHDLVGSAVPDLDGAGAVVPLRDLALERRVVERVILDVYSERALPGLERNAFRNGPRCKRTVALEAEVVVEPAGVVALHDEDRPLCTSALRGEGLGSLLGV